MSQEEPPPGSSENPVAELRVRAEALERELAATKQEASTRLIRSEMKVEAVRAGMVDLDGLKLLDLTKVEVDPEGELKNAAELMAQLRRAKPWLFGPSSSSSPASAPPSQPSRPKLATEMTDDDTGRPSRAPETHDPRVANTPSKSKEDFPHGHSKLSCNVAAYYSTGLSGA